MNRREFLASAGALPVVTTGVGLSEQAQAPAPAGDRASWVAMLRKVADPVLRTWRRARLPRGCRWSRPAATNRRAVTYLEAAGRLIAGLAPWIELAADATPEGRLRAEYAALTRRAIARAVDPASADFMNFTRERQPLVDAAFLAHGLLRARRALVDELDATTRRQLVAALESTRAIAPPFNNWLLFSATVEAGLAVLGASGIACASTMPCDSTTSGTRATASMATGRRSTGTTTTASSSSPMMLDVLDVVRDENAAWKALDDARTRTRHALRRRSSNASSDLTEPSRRRAGRSPTGAARSSRSRRPRSVARCPTDVTPPQVRGALAAVIRRSPGRAGHVR